jgi:cation diffusion facilitator family transporter
MSGATTDRSGARRVALASLLWTVVLASAKLVAGLLTGSVALLADALHSVLDAGAGGLTLYAVRLAAKPPDREHPYGHGRAENLAALAEGGLMTVVAVVVAFEAVRRLVDGRPIHPPAYAIAVLVGAIAVDVWRVRALRRGAAKYHSPALEADAMNFTGDILESCAVLLGLAAARWGLPAGDPIAAIVVAVVMVFMAVRVGVRAVNVLMDRSPEHLQGRLAEAAASVDGVRSVRDLRVRRAGPDVHAEVTVSIGRTESVERSHDITEAVEDAVAKEVPGATALVHVEPTEAGEDIVSRTFAAANRLGLADQVHNVLAIDHPDGLWLMLHAKVPAQMTLRRAHEVADALEAELRLEIDRVARVEIHLEPREPQHLRGKVVELPDLVASVRAEAERHPPIMRCHEVAVTRAPDGLHLVLHCEAPPERPIVEIHDASLRLEDEIHSAHADVRTVLVHFEPSTH